MNPKSRVHWGLILGVCLLGAVGGVFLWRATRPVDTAPPPAVLVEAKPDEPLLAEDAQQVTFILRDDQGAIPSLFLFTDESQQAMALGINTLRGTPNERGVEVRFEALRLRRDEHDPDTLWVRAVGIANETEGKTPVSLAELERGEPLDLHFHDEIQVPLVAHVLYEIRMTIQYDRGTAQLTLAQASGGIHWKMLGSETFDEGRLACEVRGRKGQYPEKPLLKF